MRLALGGIYPFSVPRVILVARATLSAVLSVLKVPPPASLPARPVLHKTAEHRTTRIRPADIPQWVTDGDRQLVRVAIKSAINELT